jgi:hypothetical protein
MSPWIILSKKETKNGNDQFRDALIKAMKAQVKNIRMLEGSIGK